MTPEELDECFEFVSNLVRKCDKILLEGFKDCGEVKSKGANHDLVTFYDHKIEEVLMNGIKEKYPNHKIIAEENQASQGQIPILTSAPTWIIDPIDGTINFIKKFHLICISVSLVIDYDLKIGILYNPATNEFYTAQKGRGAYLNGERIVASKSEKLRGSLVSPGFAFGNRFRERANALLENCHGIRVFGSAALTLGYVAKGVIDVYNVEYLKPWDIAAGALIVQEAGGVVIDKSGGDFNIMKPNIIAAGTMELALEMKNLIDDVEKKLEAEKLKIT